MVAGQYTLDNSQNKIILLEKSVKEGYTLFYASGIESGEDWHNIQGLKNNE